MKMIMKIFPIKGDTLLGFILGYVCFFQIKRLIFMGFFLYYQQSLIKEVKSFLSCSCYLNIFQIFTTQKLKYNIINIYYIYIYIYIYTYNIYNISPFLVTQTFFLARTPFPKNTSVGLLRKFGRSINMTRKTTQI